VADRRNLDPAPPARVLQRRQPRRPKLNWVDRALFPVLPGVIPKARRHGLRLLVTPARSCAGTATSSAAARPPAPCVARPADARRKHQGPGPPAGPGEPEWGYRRIHGETGRLGVPVPRRRCGRSGGLSGSRGHRSPRLPQIPYVSPLGLYGFVTLVTRRAGPKEPISSAQTCGVSFGDPPPAHHGLLPCPQPFILLADPAHQIGVDAR